jgi:hypothetical protein
MSQAVQALDTGSAVSVPGEQPLPDLQPPGPVSGTDRARPEVHPVQRFVEAPVTTAEPSAASRSTARHSIAATEWQLEEFFRGVVEEIGDDAIRVAITSSEGDEGTAWIPWSAIAESEREFAQVGAPVRISILKPLSGTRTREQRVRFLRPSQYHPPARTREHVASYLLERMNSVLSEHG